jgi:hypothetical protein
MSRTALPIVTLTAGGETNRWAVPLTSVWTPPPGCPSIVPSTAVYSSSSTCAPPLFSNAGGAWYGYYSPGICPRGYTIGCRPTGSIQNSEPIKSTESAAICVPR